MSLRAVLCGLAAALSLAAASARAQALADPTRPPNAPTPGETQESAGAAGPQLQSILISSGRKLAMINGTTVPLGGTLGEAKVVRITETEVTLQRGDETEVLKLFPGIEKQPVKRGTRIARKPQGRQQ